MKKNLVAKNELGIYADADGVVRADSLVVAQIFEKRHDNVVRDIRNLDCSEEFRLLNFEESSYTNLQGHKQACFNMTRDGFVFLVMGYRGKKAASFKEAYIKRFNEMEEFIKYLLEARTEFPLLTENILLLHESPKPYYFSNEADLLNRIALGKTAKQVREEHGLKPRTSIRPYLTTKQIEAIDRLQRVDIGLLVSTPDFQERKRYLEWYFMKIIRKAEKKIQYKIKSEKEYLRSHARGELGVRVQTSGTSDPTFNEAATNIMIEDAFKTGKVDKGLLKGIKDASLYEEEIQLVSLMRMDFELLEEIIEDLDESDSKIMKQYLLEGRLFKEIADDEGRTYEAIKKRMERIRAEIREEILECLEMNCRGGE